MLFLDSFSLAPQACLLCFFLFEGFQVAPAELERELLLHPDIVDAAVVGTPDERQGELPRGFVVCREGSQLTEKDVTDFMADRVSFPELAAVSGCWPFSSFRHLAFLVRGCLLACHPSVLFVH